MMVTNTHTVSWEDYQIVVIVHWRVRKRRDVVRHTS
jgi:hypothetical protein